MPGTYQYDVEIKSNVAKLLSDMKQVQDRLDTVEGKEYKIKLNVDEKKLSSVISNLEKMLDSLGKGTGDFKQFENLSKELSNIVSEVQSLSKAFGKVDDSGTKTLLSSIQNIDKSLAELSQNILNVNKNMSNMGGNTSGAVKQVENISNAYQNAAKEAEKLVDAQSKIGQKTNISSGSTQVSNLDKVEAKIKEIFTDAYELKQVLDSLHNGEEFYFTWVKNGKDTNIEERIYKLREVLEEYGYTIKNYKADSEAWSTSGTISLLETENNALEQNTQKVKENTQAKEQNANANLNKYNKRLDSYNGKVDKYQATIDRFNDGGWTSKTYLKNVQAVRDAVKQYATLLNNIKTNQNGIATDEDIQNLDKYEKKIKDTIATVTNMSASEKGYNFVSGQKELDKIHKLLNENSKMFSEAKAKIKAYYREIESGNPTMSLDKIHAEIMKIYNAEIEAGRAGRSLKDIFQTSRLHQMVAQVAGMFSFYDLINLGRQFASTVTDINTQITGLAKVSEQSSKQIYADFDSYADIAKEVRGTISDTIAATADWSKNGYSIPDAKQLAEVSQLYKNVGDGIDIDAANESLISTLKGFQLEADQAEHIVDVFNEVSNNEAISSGGIGEALQRSAASFNAASTSLEKSVSLVTATNSVLQNPEKVGNMWRTVSARLRGSETELKEMGEDTDGLVTSTSKLQALVKGITGFDIMKDKDTYKDIYDIVLGIGEKWQDLSDIDRASLLEALAGKQQSNALAAALSNIDILKKSYEEATNAEGSAREENEEYSKSIQASIDLTKAKLEELSNDLLSSNFLKGAIDAGGKLLDLLDFIISDGREIPAIFTTIGAVIGAKKLSYASI